MIKPTKLAIKSKQSSFWSKLKKPLFVIAPMANVTDYAFRTMFAKYGKPDVMWNEFVSADGLCSPVGRKKLLLDLKFSNKERPIVAQLFTGHPEQMRKATVLVRKLKFDGMDINMGCPDKSVEKQGGGSAHIKDPKNAIEVIRAAREGWVGNKLENEERRMKKGETIQVPISKFQNDQLINIPISVKTRIGYNKEEIDTWIRLLLEQRLPALTVHLRTRKEMSEVPAHWDLMPKIVALRDEISPETLIIGNGDVNTLEEAREKIATYGCDGVMIGRGIFGKPWFFARINEGKYSEKSSRETGSDSTVLKKMSSDGISVTAVKNEKDTIGRVGGVAHTMATESYKSIKKVDALEKSPEERLKILLEHTKLFEKTYCGKIKTKNFAVMKKHFKAYVNGWEGAKELRVKLMEANSYKEVKGVVSDYLQIRDK